MTCAEAIWDVALTAVGTVVGFMIAVGNERRVADNEFKKRRAEVLKDLLQSLKKNQEYLIQITEHHFSKGELPTFPLDTVALSFVSLNARRYLPNDSNFGERYNNLRFELDHINRKTQNFLTVSSILLPTAESHRLYDGMDGVLHKSIVQIASCEFENLKSLIERTKESLRQEIETLEKFV